MLPFFVYGTLLLGQPNDYLWQDSVLRYETAVLDSVQLYAFPHFPMMIECAEPSSQVFGQIIWVDAACYAEVLADLDILENYDPADHDHSVYQRVQREVIAAAGESILVWTYIGKIDLVTHLPLIPEGDWEKHIEKQRKSDENQSWWRNRSTHKLL